MCTPSYFCIILLPITKLGWLSKSLSSPVLAFASSVAGGAHFVFFAQHWHNPSASSAAMLPWIEP